MGEKRDECLFLHAKRWKPKYLVGSGNFASVYQVDADTGREDYVIKITRLEVEDLYSPNFPPATFVERIDIQNKVANLGYSVKVEDSWECEGEYGVMVMKRLSQNLKTYLSILPKDRYMDLLDRMYGIIDKLHKNGFTHGDIKLENIMVDTFGRLYLIDFDYSHETTDEHQRNRDLILLARTTESILKIYKSLP